MNHHRSTRLARAIARYVGALCICVVAAVPVAAQQEVEFSHLTPRNGLTGVFADPVIQDQQGYIWIGTGGGLSRYDGYEVEGYTHDPRDSTSIRPGGVLALLEEGGALWVGTYAGLSRMDMATGRFTHIDLEPSLPQDSLSTVPVWMLLRDGAGTLWAATGRGLFAVHDDEGRRITRYVPEPGDTTTLSHRSVRDLLENEDGTLWVGLHAGASDPDGGLDLFDPATGTVVQRYRHDPEDPTSLSNDQVWDLHRDAQGALWVGTRRGLCRMDEEAGTFACFTADPDDPAGLSDDDIQSVFEDEEGRLWLGTGLGGVNVFDPATGAVVQRYRHDPEDPSSISEDDVHSIFQDRFGTYWFTHHYRGVSRMTPDRVRFVTHRPDARFSPLAPTNHASDIIEEPDGVVWVSTEYGLLRYDPATDATEHFVPFPEEPFTVAFQQNPNLIVGLMEDRQGRLWMGNPTGNILVFDRMQRAFREVLKVEAEGFAFPAFIDRAGDVWVGTARGGLLRIDPGTEAVTRYLHDPTDPNSLAGWGAVPYLDALGTIWVAAGTDRDLTKLAIQRYERERDAFVTYPVPLPKGGEFMSILMLPEEPGVYWISSPEGLLRADARAGEVHLYPRSEYGLPLQMEGLQRDAQGRLWFGSWSGEFGVFDPAAGTVTRYHAEDGVRFDRFTNAKRAASGEMTFLGFGGYMRFHPQDLLREAKPPAVHVTGIRAAGATQPLPAGAEPLRLEHGQNTLSFDYVGLHYSDPARNRYRYMLEGYDDGWNNAATQRAALYPKLPPGTYTFRVQAANSEGVWNEEGAAVPLVIRPPWWRTLWAYGLYGLLLAAGVYGADRVQRRRLVARERERARERELEQARAIERAYAELKEAKDRLVQQEKLASLGALTAGIAHEIKNPLNFVNNFASLTRELAQELAEETDPEEARALLADLKTNAAKIEEHGRRADAIVRSMLEHARMGAGARDRVEVNRLVEEHVELAYHGRRAQVPSFDVTIERDYGEGVGTVEVVPQELGRVVLNLVGNAFDAVTEQAARQNGQYAPRVTVTTRRVGEGVEVRVADNGPGMAAEVKARVFEPFFTTKPSGSGTGLGLSMSHDVVVQGHGGTLTVESEPGQGAVFTVALPVPSAPHSAETS